jgi:hypothetical protein
MFKFTIIVALASGLILQSGQTSTGGRIKGPLMHRGWLRAGEFLDMSEDQKGGYVMGLLDGLYSAPNFGAPDTSKSLYTLGTCLEPMKLSQVSAIIELHIRQHPDRWHWDANSVAEEALADACNFHFEWVPERTPTPKSRP